MSIRVATVEDSALLINLFQTLDEESEFMLLEPGERSRSIEYQKEQMLNFEDNDNQIMLVKETDDKKLVGFVVGVAGNFIRNKHCVSCVLGVQEMYQRQGIGKALLLELETWAKSHKIHRIELTVMAHNDTAMRLYKSACFVEEGIKKDSIKLSGKFVNEVYMAKLID